MSNIGENLRRARIATWPFWRNVAVYFCVFSVVGHWIEIAYCLFMNMFGIVDADSLVWQDPMYPFLVYGVGVAVCAVFLVPLKSALQRIFPDTRRAALAFFGIAALVCLAMELAMGLMLNRPDIWGNYPLWDNSDLPLNVLGQAWLVNDIALGALAMFYTWVLYPLSEKLMANIPDRVLNGAAVLIVAAFIALCAVKF